MIADLALMLDRVADASAASNAMKTFVQPVMVALISLGGLAATFFLIYGGFHYITSSGKPDKLEFAKKVVKNALIGLLIVLAAATLTAILSHAYNGGHAVSTNNLPSLTEIKPEPTSGGIVDILVKAITGLFLNIIQSAAAPFLSALDYFTKATPLMADNSSVFKLWLAVVGITDVLFVLAVVALGFHVMSYASLGLDEIELKHLLPQFGLTFLLINTSIFAIDAVISLSNALINAINAAFPTASVWETLTLVTKQSSEMGFVSLLIMVVFLILAVMLLVYYVMRLVALYLGAVLSPLVALLWLLPSFKDFASSITKTYLTTIFVLFVHVIILQLASSIFGGMVAGATDNVLNPLMATVVGLATMLSLLKAQQVLTEHTLVTAGPKAVRKLRTTIINSNSYKNMKSSTSTRIKTSIQSRTGRSAKSTASPKPQGGKAS